MSDTPINTESSASSSHDSERVATDVDSSPETKRISLGKLARITWFLGWRTVLLSFSVIIFGALLGLPMDFQTGFQKGAALRLAGWSAGFTVLAFLALYAILLLVMLWVFQRFLASMLRKRFRGFHVDLIRDTAPHKNRLSLWETCKVGWLIWWRATLAGTLTGAIVGGTFGFMHPPESVKGPPTPAPGWLRLLILALVVFIVVPWAVRGIFRKRFVGFQFRLSSGESALTRPSL